MELSPFCYFHSPQSKNGCFARNCGFRNVPIYWVFCWISAHYCIVWTFSHQLGLRGSNSFWRLRDWSNCTCGLRISDAAFCLYSKICSIGCDYMCHDFYNRSGSTFANLAVQKDRYGTLHFDIFDWSLCQSINGIDCWELFSSCYFDVHFRNSKSQHIESKSKYAYLT